MAVGEDAGYSVDYLNQNKRSIANAVQVFFKDGSSTNKVAVEYPLGHRRRRDAAIPLLKQKFQQHLATRFSEQRCEPIHAIFIQPDTFAATPVNQFMALFYL